MWQVYHEFTPFSLSEMIKSASINCFSMLERRSSSSYLLPHPPPPHPHVFDAVAVMNQALQSILSHTWCRVFELNLDVHSYLSIFLHTSLHSGLWDFCSSLHGIEMRSEHASFWVKAQGHKPSKLIQKCSVVDVTTCKTCTG